uniref:Cnn_1N domain-containing protein n=1 Tax=Syphacia muris TaxID=451379 RepID=A0A0N5ACY4_9BILA
MAVSPIVNSTEVSRALLNQYVSNRNFIREVLNGSDLDTLNLLDLLDRIRHNWAQEVEKNAALMDNINSLKNELELRLKELSSANEHLRHARAQITTLISEKHYYEEIERKFQLVKELIK